MNFIEAIKNHNDEIYLWHEITNYLAMDPDGRVFGYEKKPTPGIIGWSVEGESNSTDGCGCRIELNTDEIDNAWSVCIVTREQYEAALSASKPDWDGEGLPPVGCECEYETKFDGWQPVRIELIKSEGIAFTWLANSQAYNGLDCVGVQKSGSFRPARSEEERKRDEAVKEFVRQLIECVDLHAMDKRNIDIVREKLYSMLPTLPGVTVID